MTAKITEQLKFLLDSGVERKAAVKMLITQAEQIMKELDDDMKAKKWKRIIKNLQK